MEEIINKLINYHIKGVDIYTHGGSTWLIFTKTKQWVIELTDDKTLWYNYNFFSTIFSYASLGVIDNQQYITKWVEDNVMSKVGEIYFRDARDKKQQFEDTLENGVKHTEYGDWLDGDERLGDIIQDGIKETQFNTYENKRWVEGVIGKGVKQTLPEVGRYINDVEEVIEDGVKSSHPLQYKSKEIIDGVVNDGIKETHDDVYHHKGRIDGVINNGVKEVNSYDEYKRGPVNAFGYIDDIIETGIKKTHPMENSVNSEQWFISEQIVNNHIQTGIKEGEKINGTYAGGKRQSEKCKSVVEYGTKNPTD